MNKGIDLIFTFSGNPRSEKIINVLTQMRQDLAKQGQNDETKYMVLQDERSPLLQMARTSGRSAVALVDSTDLPCGKHFQPVLSGSADARGLPAWTTVGQYIYKIGLPCCDARRCAEQLHAIFVRTYRERMEQYPLPWGSAKDPMAQQRRRELKRRKRQEGFRL